MGAPDPMLQPSNLLYLTSHWISWIWFGFFIADEKPGQRRAQCLGSALTPLAKSFNSWGYPDPVRAQRSGRQ
jgi:hypothetical protein